MTPFWVDTGPGVHLAIIPRPRGDDWLESEVEQIKQAGIDLVVSMLERDEAAELGLSQEELLCVKRGIDFYSFPIPDRETPRSTVDFTKFVDKLRAELHSGRRMAVHCRASIGRSSLLLAALLTTEGLFAQ